MKRGSTHFLRFVVVLLGAIVLALCVFALPGAWKGGSGEFPAASRAVLAIALGLYAAALPFFAALWQALKLLARIDAGTAFSDASVASLRTIKRCAVAISVIFIAFVPLLYPIADAEDAPGLILFGAVIACAPVAVAVFAALLERLLQDAIAMKSENDLTV